MEEPKKDLNTQGDGTPAGDGQPDKKPVSNGGAGKDNDAPAEEMVSISKSALETLKEKTESYRKAVIRLNREKGRFLPGGEPDQQPNKPKAKEDDDDDFGNGDDDDKDKKSNEAAFKADLQRRDEKTAIAIACEDLETEENWDDIVIYYEPKHGKNDVKSILTDIRAAKAEWKKRQPAAKPQDTHKKASGELAADSGAGKGKEKPTQTKERKHIIPRSSEGITGWYKTKK